MGFVSLKMAASSSSPISLTSLHPISSPSSCNNNKILLPFRRRRCHVANNRIVHAFPTPNGSVSLSASHEADSQATEDAHSRRSSLESLFCYDKAIPEERIEKPVGLSLAEKEIGNKPRCDDCHAKGVVLCATCSGSGLYVDAILESQGIIVKVRCLGCGGSGNIMCSQCGGKGHL